MAFTREEKLKAIRLYLKTHSLGETIRQLGYPSKGALHYWLQEYKQTGTVHGGTKPRYSPQQREAAVQYLFKSRMSIKKSVKAVAYPLSNVRWITPPIGLCCQPFIAIVGLK
ncbi:transposase [Mesosutterella sp. AGMB02718]|uniref:Transposase n=1 Tax=Mesosutterella faecium TaxID=2925194 RepID=A0ABT7IKE3_9BURK|nr:transposase [Mesosutterella sp. AGMB02718]MDL2058835.1 transposase [Mesosutterella sp. AGMB02718]